MPSPLSPRSLFAAAAIAITLASLTALSAGSGNAAKNATEPVVDRPLELLVLEIRNCDVCDVVRHQIQPFYTGGQRSKVAPMRFVDITSINELELGLSSEVRMLPTVVLMKEGREIDRLSGLLATDVYLETLNNMVDAAR